MSRLSGRTYKFTWDPGSISSNAQATLDITIPNSKLGDILFVTAMSDIEHLSLFAHIEADNTGDIHLANSTGGPIDIGETVFNVLHVRAGAFF